MAPGAKFKEGAYLDLKEYKDLDNTQSQVYESGLQFDSILT